MANGKYIDIPRLERALAKVGKDMDSRARSDFKNLFRIAKGITGNGLSVSGLHRAVDKMATLEINPGYAYLRGINKIRLLTVIDAMIPKSKSGIISLKGYYLKCGDGVIRPLKDCVTLDFGTDPDIYAGSEIKGDYVAWQISPDFRSDRKLNLHNLSLLIKGEYNRDKEIGYLAVKVEDNGDRIFYSVPACGLARREDFLLPKLDMRSVTIYGKFHLINGRVRFSIGEPILNTEVQVWLRKSSRTGFLGKSPKSRITAWKWVSMYDRFIPHNLSSVAVRVRYKSRKHIGEWKYYHVSFIKAEEISLCRAIWKRSKCYVRTRVRT